MTENYLYIPVRDGLGAKESHILDLERKMGPGGLYVKQLAGGESVVAFSPEDGEPSSSNVSPPHSRFFHPPLRRRRRSLLPPRALVRFKARGVARGAALARLRGGAVASSSSAADWSRRVECKMAPREL